MFGSVDAVGGDSDFIYWGRLQLLVQFAGNTKRKVVDWGFLIAAVGAEQPDIRFLGYVALIDGLKDSKGYDGLSGHFGCQCMATGRPTQGERPRWGIRGKVNAIPG